jgi:hypothetical protein
MDSFYFSSFILKNHDIYHFFIKLFNVLGKGFPQNRGTNRGKTGFGTSINEISG